MQPDISSIKDPRVRTFYALYWRGVQTRKLEFKSMGVEHYATLPRAELLAELARIDAEMHAYLTSTTFDSNRSVDVFWGGAMDAIDVLFSGTVRDHDILHIGWNLALMDHLNMPRYQSQVQY